MVFGSPRIQLLWGPNKGKKEWKLTKIHFFSLFCPFRARRESKVGLEIGRTRTHLFSEFQWCSRVLWERGRHLTQSSEISFGYLTLGSWAHIEGHSSLILQHRSSGTDFVVAHEEGTRKRLEFRHVNLFPISIPTFSPEHFPGKNMRVFPASCLKLLRN